MKKHRITISTDDAKVITLALFKAMNQSPAIFSGTLEQRERIRKLHDRMVKLGASEPVKEP